MGIIQNTATLEAIVNGTPTFALTNTTTWTRMTQSDSISGVKVPHDILVKPGEIIEIVNAFDNTGLVYPQPVFRDVLDVKTVFIDGSVKINGMEALSSQCKYEGNVLTVTPGIDLEAGETLVISFQVKILQP